MERPLAIRIVVKKSTRSICRRMLMLRFNIEGQRLKSFKWSNQSVMADLISLPNNNVHVVPTSKGWH